MNLDYLEGKEKRGAGDSHDKDNRPRRTHDRLTHVPNQDEDGVSDQLHLYLRPGSGSQVKSATVPAIPATTSALLAAPAPQLLEVPSFPRSVERFCFVSVSRFCWFCG